VAAVGEAEALERLHQILARPEFQEGPQPLWTRAFVAVRDWLADLLLALLGGVPDAALGRSGWVQAVLVLLALAALLALAIYVARAIGLSVSGGARRRAEAARVRARSDALWREGQALGQQGRYGEACRALYLSALYALEEHDLLRVEAGQTNREHAARAVRDRPELAATFQRLVGDYDRLRYGHYAVDRPAFEALAELVARTRRFRPAPSGGAPPLGAGVAPAA
jgi:hypothetical protein